MAKSSRGLKVGIEIHQQLNTSKLFCSCPSLIKETEPDYIIERKQRAVVGEMGIKDAAAKLEEAKKKTFVYYVYNDCNCLIETDGEPPRQVNEEALRISLQVALLLGMTPVDEVQFMRKIIIDGSVTSGFQRTALLAIGGRIKTTEGVVRINQLSMEEDAARKISESENKVVFSLDRLGIPLVELTTEADIKTPQQAKEVAEKLGLILRSCNVKRGIGTIRQDINVSIKGGDRVEIKGTQDLRLIPKVVETEIERQISLIKIKKELKKRKFSEKELKGEFIDITNLFSKTECKFISDALKKGDTVLAVKIPKFDALLRETRFGKELSAHAKLYAGLGGLLHSDELPKYGVTGDEVKSIKNKLSCRKDDAFIFVIGPGNLPLTALTAVLERVKKAPLGVPREVRKVETDASTTFLRPLPGRARMYPETDVRPVAISTNFIGAIKKVLPKKPEEKLKHYCGLGLNEELAGQILHSRVQNEFEELTSKMKNLSPTFVASSLLGWKKELKNRYDIDDVKNNSLIIEALVLADAGKIAKDNIHEIIAESIKSSKKINSIAEKFSPADNNKIREEVKKIVAANKDANFSALMGDLMKKFKGKVDGRTLAKLLKEEMK